MKKRSQGGVGRIEKVTDMIICEIESLWEVVQRRELNQCSATTWRGGMGWGGRFRREGTYVYLWLIHVVVRQKPIQHYKAIILQIKKRRSQGDGAAKRDGQI